MRVFKVLQCEGTHLCSTKWPGGGAGHCHPHFVDVQRRAGGVVLECLVQSHRVGEWRKQERDPARLTLCPSGVPPTQPPLSLREQAGVGSGLETGNWRWKSWTRLQCLRSARRRACRPSQVLLRCCGSCLPSRAPLAPVPPVLSGLTLLFCFSEVELPLKKDGFTSESTTLEALLRGEGVEKKVDAREEENIQEIQVFLCLWGSWSGRR